MCVQRVRTHVLWTGVLQQRCLTRCIKGGRDPRHTTTLVSERCPKLSWHGYILREIHTNLQRPNRAAARAHQEKHPIPLDARLDTPRLSTTYRQHSRVKSLWPISIRRKKLSLSSYRKRPSRQRRKSLPTSLSDVE